MQPQSHPDQPGFARSADDQAAIARLNCQVLHVDLVEQVARRARARSAGTAEASVVLSWSEADIVVLIGIYPQVSLNVIRVIGTRLIELQDRVRELATQRADQRLARALLRLIRNDGGDEVAFPLRRKDLAEFSGTTLHTASRMLSAWARAGLLTSIGRRILIHDRTALDSLAEGRPLL